MAAGIVARQDLRSYALRRCIRFYTAVVLVSLAMVGTQQGITHTNSEEIFLGIATLLVVLAVVEVAAGLVMLQMVKVRDQEPGPETSLWRFAQGAGPSWVAAVLFVAVAALMVFGESL